VRPLIRVPVGAIEQSLAAIQRVGRGDREIALFWLGDAASLTVDTVVLPRGPGVRFEPMSLRLSETWMLGLAEMCDDRGVVVLGAMHSHPGAAFMSEIDRDAFFHAPDVVSVVVPDYGRTAIEDALTAWAVFVGLRGTGWRAGTWGGDLELSAGGATLEELGGMDVPGA
jgi:hypothetical protein